MEIQEIANILNKLGVYLDSTGQEVFRIYLEQVRVETILNLYSISFLLLTMVGGAIALKYLHLWKDSENYNDYRHGELRMIPMAILYIFLTVSIILVISMGFTTLGMWMNPEYYAIQKLLTNL